MCTISRRDYYDINTDVMEHHGQLHLLHCHPGLKDLGRLAGGCRVSFYAGEFAVSGATPLQIKEVQTFPKYLKDCSSVFGEAYALLNCLKLCPQHFCPLTKVDINSCANRNDKVISVVDNSYLSVILPMFRDGK